MRWHPMVNAGQSGATAESNLADIERIRKMPVSIKNPEWEGIDDTDNDEFIDNPIRIDAISGMVAANVVVVLMKVESYIGLHPSVSFLYDDLVGWGLVGLTEAINKLADRETPEDGGNPNGFIGQRIIWAITDAIDKDTSQTLPLGYEPPGASVGDIDPREIVETKDLLYASCLTLEDVTIIEMRANGCRDQEIADRLDISRAAVGMMRNEIQRRYEALSKEEDDQSCNP